MLFCQKITSPWNYVHKVVLWSEWEGCRSSIPCQSERLSHHRCPLAHIYRRMKLEKFEKIQKRFSSTFVKAQMTCLARSRGLPDLRKQELGSWRLPPWVLTAAYHCKRENKKWGQEECVGAMSQSYGSFILDGVSPLESKSSLREKGLGLSVRALTMDRWDG